MAPSDHLVRASISLASLKTSSIVGTMSFGEPRPEAGHEPVRSSATRLRARAVLTAVALGVSLSALACGASSDDKEDAQQASEHGGASGSGSGRDTGGTHDGGGAQSGGSGGTRTPRGGRAGADPSGGASSGDDAGEGGGGSRTDGEGGSSAAGAPATAGLCHVAVTCAEPVPNDQKVLCSFEVRDPSGAVVYSDHAGMELRGNSSLRYPKKNYSLELRTAAGLDHPENLLRAGKDADWVLDGSWLDRSFLRNDLAFELFRDTGYYAPESRYCTLTLDSEEQGVYRLVERIKRDDDRVAIAADDGTAKSFIIRQDNGGKLEFPLGWQPSWKLVYPKQESATPAQVLAVQSWLDGLRAALSRPAASSSMTGIFEYLDFDATVDWVLLQELAKNIDAYNVSVHLTRDAGGRAKFVPWDLDLAFGQPSVSIEAASSNARAEGWITKRTDFILALSAVPGFRARLVPRWRELRATTLSTEHVLAEMDALRAILDPQALAANFAIWPLASVDASIVDGDYSMYEVTSYDDEVSKLRAWIEARLRWIDVHIDAYPG